MSPSGIVVVGLGGHASDVASLAERAGWKVGYYAVDEMYLPDSDRRDVRALGPVLELPYIAGIGYPAQRRDVVRRLEGSEPAVALVDPSAVVLSDVGAGSVVFWQSAISSGCDVGPHVVISYGCTIGHDVTIGEGASVFPGANVSGNVIIGAGALVGAGAVIREKVTIGASAVIGAGAVVIDDVPAGATAVGVPARWS